MFRILDPVYPRKSRVMAINTDAGLHYRFWGSIIQESS